MHALYCRDRNNADKSVCQLYAARKSGSSRPALPATPPTKQELDAMHNMFCGIREYSTSYPCQKWKVNNLSHQRRPPAEEAT